MIVDIAKERPHIARDVRRLRSLQMTGDIARVDENAAQDGESALVLKDARESIGRGILERLVLQRIDQIVKVIEDGQIRIHYMVHDAVEELVRPLRGAGRLAGLLDDG